MVVLTKYLANKNIIDEVTLTNYNTFYYTKLLVLWMNMDKNIMKQ